MAKKNTQIYELRMDDRIALAGQMTAIIERLNRIGENPLHRDEVVQLRRAYAKAVVQYFDGRQQPLSGHNGAGEMTPVSVKLSNG